MFSPEYRMLGESFVYNYNLLKDNYSVSSNEILGKVFNRLCEEGIKKTELVFSDVVISRAALLEKNSQLTLNQAIWKEKGPISIEQFRSLIDNMPIVDYITTGNNDWPKLMSDRITEIKNP